MGVCTSKKNRISEDKYVVKQSRSLHRSVCNELGIIVIGYIRQIINKYNFRILPSDIKTLCTLFYGSIDGDLIIERGQTLTLKDMYYEYNSILIKKNATLTVTPWNNAKRDGGLLNIVCTGNIVLEHGASINLNGKGYEGGNFGRNGESFHIKRESTKSRKPNFGGGGGGQINGAHSSYGGGAGYGSIGDHGKYVEIDGDKDCMDILDDNTKYNGIGGNIYGDKQLSILHLGSGGGCGYCFDSMNGYLRSNKGGDGGGALKLQCFGSILMDNGAKICCNGMKGNGDGAGAGSGGSMHIIIGDADKLKMDYNCSIQAIGGLNKIGSGNGGHGRIRIEYMSKSIDSIHSIDYQHNITPKPYIG